MSETKMQDPGSRERYAEDTVEHRMTVLHDDGLYRHLRFRAARTSIGWFDLITWPGNLTIRGDCGTYVFSRMQDMFEFFRGSRINPGYWSEKTPGGTTSCKRFSQERFNKRVAEALADAETDWPGVTAAWNEKVSGDWPEYYTNYEAEARAALDAFSYAPAAEDFKPVAVNREGFRFGDAWEWDLSDFQWEFLWCCYAIQWGIQQYDAARVQGSAA